MRPRHDPPPGAKRPARVTLNGLRIAARRGRPRRGGDPEADACPVAPDRPLDLSGGAAAALPVAD